MGKNSSVYVERGLSESVTRSLLIAEEADLRVLSALLLIADEDGRASLSEAEAVLGMESADFRASVKFWRGAGVLLTSKSTRAAKISAPENVTDERESAHKNGVVARIVGVEEYTNDELASVLEARSLAAFVDEAQKVMGRIFNKNEVSKLVGLVDQLGFEQEAVLAILSYCVRLDKKSLSYAEKVALSFYDDDISSADAVHERIDYLERRNSTVGKIQSLFGFGGRKLSANEKKYFITWTEEWGFTPDVVRLAYDITVDSINEPAPKYTNSILKKWYENGVRTAADVDSFIEEEKKTRQKDTTPRTSKPAQAKVQKNSEIEDWFEQRLRQSFGE